MEKYRPRLSESEKEILKNLSELDFSDYTEADIREEYIVPIMSMLGYSKNKDYSISREESFNLNEAFINVGSKRVRLDYIFSIRKKYFWLVDAKSGKRGSPEIQKEDVYQAYFYSIHPEVNCIYFGVCNGWYFNLYERDSFDDFADPIISIKSEEIARRFLELDRYIGITQIIPMLKKRLLNQIEKVLSSEIVEERLEEFKTQVNYSISRIRPQVLENFRENMKKIREEEKERRKHYLSSLGGWQAIDTLFETSQTFQELYDTSKIVYECDEFQRYQGAHGLLMSNLMLEELRPVSYWYFVNIVFFLCYLVNEDVEYINYGIGGHVKTSVQDHLNYWVKEVYTRFENRRDIRLLTIFEGEVRRFIKHILVMTREARNGISKVVLEEKYYIPEEELSGIVVCEARTILQIMNRYAKISLSHFVDRFYKHRKINDTLVIEEVETLKRLNDEFIKDNGEVYEGILKELGSSWSELTWTESNFKDFDPIISATSNILIENIKAMSLLNEDVKVQIGKVASLSVSTYTEELCKKYSIEYEKITAEKKIELRTKFFNHSYQSN